MYLADQLIITLAPKVPNERANRLLTQLGMRIDAQLSESVFTVRRTETDLDAGATPNDQAFPEQWGAAKRRAVRRCVGADVNAPPVWDLVETADGTVIAVLDSGLNFSHVDLQNIAWSNPGEIPGDGINNDGNGYIDDVTGWNFVSSNNNPADNQSHGQM
jgi:subtilisin family serine protease